MGDLLVDAGVITKEQLSDALDGASTEGRQLADELHALGLANERLIAEALAESTEHPAIVLTESTLDLAPLEHIPRVVAERHPFLPVAIDDETITVAVADNAGGRILDEVALATSRRVVPLMAVRDILVDGIPAAYEARMRGEKVLKGLVGEHDAAHLEIVRAQAPEREETLELLIGDLAASAGDLLPSGVQDQPIPVFSPTKSQSSPTRRLHELNIAEAEFGSSSGRPKDAEGRAFILVVEDDAEIRGLIRRALTHDGHYAMEAATGDQAVDQLRTLRPDVVVLDAMLPGVHGFDICSRIKQSQAFANTRVVMVSAVYRGWEQSRHIQEVHGADAFVEKPFEVHYLRKLIGELVGRELNRRELPPDRQRMIADHMRRTEACMSAQDWNGALEHIRAWLELDPFDPISHLFRGNAHSGLGDVASALPAYENAAVYGPRVFIAQLNLALTYERLGFTRRARERFARARDLAPDPATRARLDARVRAQ